ncbi:MAG: hypothetical protein P8016_14240, partial [Sedimentisphaerales bacterium]
MKVRFFVCLLLATIIMPSCNSQMSEDQTNIGKVHLITLDPGHFHAALVQKSMYDNVDPQVHV